MRILITGGAGFIGAHVIEHFLRNTDFDIVTLDRLDTSGNPGRLVHLLPERRLQFIYWDLRSPVSAQVAEWIGNVDWVLHIAAATHVDRSITHPMEFVLDNVVGTTNALEFARQAGVRFFYFSTDEVFGPAPSGIRYKEWDAYNSGNPYAATKAGAEEMCLAYANTYKMKVIISHCMNVYGERQNVEKFFPMTIKKVLAGEKVLIHSDATKTVPGSRFYIHARNVAAAVLFLMRDEMCGDKYNIVGEREVDNLELARLIAGAVGKPLISELVSWHESRPGHDLRYALDGGKMAALGWKIPVSFEESLDKTVQWTLEHPEWMMG